MREPCWQPVISLHVHLACHTRHSSLSADIEPGIRTAAESSESIRAPCSFKRRGPAAPGWAVSSHLLLARSRQAMPCQRQPKRLCTGFHYVPPGGPRLFDLTLPCHGNSSSILRPRRLLSSRNSNSNGSTGWPTSLNSAAPC